jgi:hypothetical protein
MRRRLVTLRRGFLGAALLVGVAMTPCGGGGTVGVTLQEFSVIPDQESVSAGEVTFEVENTGPEDVHEFVVNQDRSGPRCPAHRQERPGGGGRRGHGGTRRRSLAKPCGVAV